VSCSYPVLMDYDRNYVRVRLDLYNRLCQETKGMDALKIPEEKVRDLLAADPENAVWYAGVEPEVEDDVPDADPTNIEDDDDESENTEHRAGGPDGGSEQDLPGPEREQGGVRE
jgi:hypothetical protein